MSTTKWRVSAHAMQRITERYGIAKASVANWANQLMGRARYVCNGVDDGGRACRVFCADKRVINADLVEDVIITVYDAQVQRPAAPAIADTLAREIRKMEIALLKREQSAIAERAPIEAEIVSLRLTMARMKTASRRQSLAARINELEARLREINEDITKQKRELTLFAQGYASIM